jgi:kinetochore protein Nuf2
MDDTGMTFPTLKVAEIVSCSDELRVPLTQDDIKNPQPNVIKKVLELYLEMFLQLNIAEIQQPTFEAMMVEFPQLHEASVPTLVSSTAMKYMMNACGVMDFSMQDIVNPESKRIKKLLSALINFAKFREMQMSSVDQLLEERDMLTAEALELQQINDERTGTIEEIRAAQEADAPKVAALEAQCEALSNQIAQLNDAQAGIQSELLVMKNEITNASDETAKVIFEIQAKQQTTNQLGSKIVQSPERIKKEIVEMNHAVEREQKNLVGSERRVRELTLRVEGVTQIDGDVERGIKELTEVASEIGRLKKTRAETAQASDSTLAEKGTLKEITALEAQLKRQIDMVSDRMMSLSSQYGMKQEAGEQSILKAQRERDNLASDKSKAKELTTQNQKASMASRERLRELETQHTAEMATLRKEHTSLLGQIENYHRELELAMVVTAH